MTDTVTRYHDPLHKAFDEQENVGAQQLETTDFDVIVEKAQANLSRRGFLRGSTALGLSALVFGTTALTRPASATSRFGFDAVPASTADTVTVPNGYTWDVLVRWGDPLWSKGAAFDHETRGTAASQELAFGDNNDGMVLFTQSGRSVLAVNNEYINRSHIFGNREDGKPATADDVKKGMAAHGVSVFEIEQTASGWSVVRDSSFNRRITAKTPMAITGPARGDAMMKTKADPKGEIALGTWNNCGNGRTPWGTYLTCEENFNGYFMSSDEAALTAAHKRYGIKAEDRGYGWSTVDERFDVAKSPNEPNRFGYIVEIDPLDPNSTPKKRTALGRFKHENAEVVIAANGHAVVYMGDDERGEFLYRFVSKEKYVLGGNNADLLAEGDLYVAKFHEDGSGEWLALTPKTTGMASMAEVCIHTRQAASAVGATTMDRPEWVSAHPGRAEVCCALTNNKNRGVKTNAGGDETPVGGPNPRAKNNYGQIVTWRPGNEDHTAPAFAWDLFVVAGNPTVHSDAYAGSDNVNADNMFNSPDGLAFDTTGLLWIQTDGNYSNDADFAGMGNNQMLVGDPDSGEIRRFMTGPKECEITGVTWSADRRTMFVGIQHPGEKGGSHFPEGGNAVPRSCIVAVRRDDGGLIG